MEKIEDIINDLGKKPYTYLDKSDQSSYFPTAITLKDDDEEIFITIEAANDNETKFYAQKISDILNGKFKEFKRIKKWSRKHDYCVSCNSNKIPHIARGLCQSCYSLNYFSEKVYISRNE
jgi:hypothetical protein